MSTLNPFNSSLPTKPLKHLVALRGDKVDSVPADGEYIGLEQMESGTGRLSEVELQQQPEGSANVFQPGDVLFGKLRPYLAKGWTADRPGYCTTEALVLQPKGADPRFVRYCVLAAEFIEAVNGSTYGSKMPRADWSFVGAVQVPCPTQSVQEHIANFLDEQTARIDALIAEKERLDSLLSEYRQSLISEAVTGRLNVGTPDAESRGGEAGEGVGVTVSFFGELPPRWKTVPLKHAVQLNPEVLPESTAPDEELLYIDIAALEGGSADLSPKTLTFGDAPSRARRVLRSGDTIVSTVRTYLRAVATFPTVGVRLVASTGFAVLRPAGRLHPRFAYWAVLSDPFVENVVAHSEGVSYPAINPSVLGALPVVLPPMDEQQRIANFLDEQTARIDALKAHVKEHIALLREYRSSLISAAVTGQLDLSTFQAAA